MKLKFKKGFDGDLSKLPTREVEGSTVFREPETIEKLSLIANTLGLALTVITLIPVFIVTDVLPLMFSDPDALIGFYIAFLIGSILTLVTMPIHEILHSLCFKEEVEFYTYLKKGLLFVVGTESMTKFRFVFMSMLPNIAFGFIPYILFFIFPSQVWLGVWGAFCIGAGAGDYINVFNAITQMPKGSLCYMSGSRTYWYMP